MSYKTYIHLVSVVKKKILSKFYKVLIRVRYFGYPDLQMGKNIYFMGFPKFSNKPGGKIVIGDDCTFLSNRTANMIGINRPCIISTQKAGAVVIIGSKCGFSGTVIGSFVSIRIEDNVRCGANTLITDSDWHLDDPRSGLPSPVLIGKNVWIGEGVKILKGVNIGENSLVGAGSVVVKSIPPNVIAAGNPCEVIRKLK